MSRRHFLHLRLYLTALVILVDLAHLTWEHFNGGVQSHHILHRSDMPAISNWWDALVLPVLTWLLTGRSERRITLVPGGMEPPAKLHATVVAGFVGSFLSGILLSASFVNDYATIASYSSLGILLLAIVLPLYRAECVLGFVLGMTLAFGSVLPAVFGSLVAAVSAVAHFYVRPALVRVWSGPGSTRTPTT